ncbi:MAG: hypothetical protein KKA79_10460 [Nanoarchaeota archaeon]|nr:hypothetical protein [Nanoarchaeota archaeon]MCG2718504.1 hypothetical protein [Nanoarchaeota archaeon]
MIRKARISDAENISKIMLNDLINPNPNFTERMIKKFREHAQIGSIKKEFENSDIIILVFEEDNKILGFVVGYKENKVAFLHYVSGLTKNIKLKLIKSFEKKCKYLKLKEIKTDTFEFMENKHIFEKADYKFFKSEDIKPKLKMLWYKKRIR